MADIHIKESHSLPVNEARERASSFEDMFSKYGIKPKWSGNSAKIKAPGVKGGVEVTSSDVTIDLKLGMLAKAAGIKSDKLEASIRKRLRAALDA